MKVELDDILKILDPGKLPCDCCVLEEFSGLKYWRQDCDCLNNGDLAEAAGWCERRNLLDKVVTAFNSEPEGIPEIFPGTMEELENLSINHKSES